ncbi:MAG TPA: FkbM family methyltransferase [Cyanobacteria bacterium UBA8156]|jgi:FkbM family methyltransferase|nr:FkbM family methyltransferase [Cyanobacteria bacterium UBA8156]
MLFTQKLQGAGKLTDLHFTLMQVGSRKIYEGDFFPRWQVLAPHFTVYGFEADPTACAEANQAAAGLPWHEQHFPYAIAGQTGAATLYLTHFRDCSSLYRPNLAIAQRFGMDSWLQVEQELPVTTTTLAAVCRQHQLRSPDVLRVDVQGAEREVLRGAAAILPHVLAIEVEVEFLPLYQGQPLFEDVDCFLRSQGFTLWDLRLQKHRRVAAAVYSTATQGQLVWAEALYFRDPLATPPTWQGDRRQHLKLACIAEAFDYPDFTVELLSHLTFTSADDPATNLAALLTETLRSLAGDQPLALLDRLAPYHP